MNRSALMAVACLLPCLVLGSVRARAQDAVEKSEKRKTIQVSYGQVVSFAGHKWRPTIEAGYDFKDDPGNPKWVLRAAISLLLPK